MTSPQVHRDSIIKSKPKQKGGPGVVSKSKYDDSPPHQKNQSRRQNQQHQLAHSSSDDKPTSSLRASLANSHRTPTSFSEENSRTTTNNNDGNKKQVDNSGSLTIRILDHEFKPPSIKIYKKTLLSFVNSETSDLHIITCKKAGGGGGLIFGNKKLKPMNGSPYNHTFNACGDFVVTSSLSPLLKLRIVVVEKGGFGSGEDVMFKETTKTMINTNPIGSRSPPPAMALPVESAEELSQDARIYRSESSQSRTQRNSQKTANPNAQVNLAEQKAIWTRNGKLKELSEGTRGRQSDEELNNANSRSSIKAKARAVTNTNNGSSTHNNPPTPTKHIGILGNGSEKNNDNKPNTPPSKNNNTNNNNNNSSSSTSKTRKNKQYREKCLIHITDEYRFDPKSVVVSRNCTVTWRLHKDVRKSVEHSLIGRSVADDGEVCFTSPVLQKVLGNESYSLKMDESKPELINYRCENFPEMEGVIRVVDPCEGSVGSGGKGESSRCSSSSSRSATPVHSDGDLEGAGEGHDDKKNKKQKKKVSFVKLYVVVEGRFFISCCIVSNPTISTNI